MEENWPNFFIVGAPKAGTTSLYHYLSSIENIYMSPVKEPNYFAVEIIPDDFPVKPIRSKKEYLGLFSKAQNEKILGEASTNYLMDSKAPELIFQKSPNAKILISIRDPVERCFSHYLHLLSRGREKRPFHEAIRTDRNAGGWAEDYLNGSLYANPIKNYIKTFGKENVKVIIFEHWIKNTRKTIQEIINFLGISSKVPEKVESQHNEFRVPRFEMANHFFTSNTMKKIGSLILPDELGFTLRDKIMLKKASKPSLGKEDKEYLRKYFSDDISDVKKLLKIEPPWSI